MRFFARRSRLGSGIQELLNVPPLMKSATSFEPEVNPTSTAYVEGCWGPVQVKRTGRRAYPSLEGTGRFIFDVQPSATVRGELFASLILR
jgi:hypothetical protein